MAATQTIKTTQTEVRGYQFFGSVSYPYPQRTIRTFLQIDIRIRSVSVTIVFHVFKVRARSKQTECETTPVGGQLQDAHANLAQTCADQSRASAVDRHIQRLI